MRINLWPDEKMIETESYRKKNSDVNITSFIDQGSRDVLLKGQRSLALFCFLLGFHGGESGQRPQ